MLHPGLRNEWKRKLNHNIVGGAGMKIELNLDLSDYNHIALINFANEIQREFRKRGSLTEFKFIKEDLDFISFKSSDTPIYLKYNS